MNAWQIFSDNALIILGLSLCGIGVILLTWAIVEARGATTLAEQARRERAAMMEGDLWSLWDTLIAAEHGGTPEQAPAGWEPRHREGKP